MKKVLIVFFAGIFIFFSLFAGEMRTRDSKKSGGAAMRTRDSGKSSGAKMRVRNVKMTWQFQKGDVNPTVTFYDVSDNNKEILKNIKLDKSFNVEIECKKGNTICFGGDFSLVNKPFVAGCGDNCKYYTSMSQSDKNQACQKCENKTVKRKVSVRKKGR
jgi:hypothetical protein